MSSCFRLSETPAVVLVAGMFSWVGGGVYADDTASQSVIVAAPVDQIVVVAHKDERSIREIAANVTILSRAELSSQLATSASIFFAAKVNPAIGRVYR